MPGFVGRKMKLECVGSVVFNTGTPSWAWQNGSFENTITDNGTGDVTLNLKQGLDALEGSIGCFVNGALAASQLTTFGIAHTSDTAKRITILREGAAGAVSALTDVNFDVWVACYE